MVLVSTPDHHHAPAAIRSIQRGIPVFSQKPLAHNIYECRTLAEAAKQHKVLTQMGNQGHCGEGYRRLVECIWAGAIGNVTETHTIFNRDFGGTGGIPPGKPAPGPRPLGRVAGPRALPRLSRRPASLLLAELAASSAPARWATWPATAWTGCSGASSCYEVKAYRHRVPRRSRAAARRCSRRAT